MRVTIIDGKVLQEGDVMNIVKTMKSLDVNQRNKNYKYRRDVQKRIPEVDITSDERFIKSLAAMGLVKIEEES